MFDKKKNIVIKVWTGTPAHMSLDTRLHKRFVELLRLEGFDAQYRGDWSLEPLDENGEKTALVTHHARGAYKYRYTPAQTDAEEIMLDMAVGKLPKTIRLYVTAHNHTTEGSAEVGLIKVLRCPCFTTFIPYKGSLTLLPHYQPDIGAWFVIVTKEGRVRTQEWLYPTFMYHDTDDEIIIHKNPEKSHASPEDSKLEKHLKALLEDAQKVIMVIADTHVGELYSVAPPSFKFDGRTISGYSTKCNTLLYNYWKHLIKMAKEEFKVDEIWVVGDVFGGGNIFEKYRNPLTKSLDEQVYMALELFRLLK